jgi:hypothetical protein
MAQSQAVHTFVLGNKELEGKTAEFQYDRGWYSISDIIGEERKIIYRSKNAQEAYLKWNVYIGRKKERPQRVNTEETRVENKTFEKEHDNFKNAYKEKSEEHPADKRKENKGRSDNRNRQENNKGRQERYSNRPNRTRRERVNHMLDEELPQEDNNTSNRTKSGNYRRDYTHRHKKEVQTKDRKEE